MELCVNYEYIGISMVSQQAIVKIL
jgi:hypothetical protein